ncbi:uncharacterized protein LAJ45_02994 [Morchella importuna]|uniref:uncharacterized protein n=1 Tax=Morchella importuna TaxID=1174673 RepID=UPI001E8DE062|nr:uncharacterized protein LAJ45_02994 [Morchella importuna]KAH8152769.1 hypothetical protein LAJ45_02994 [Morchella importuna]
MPPPQIVYVVTGLGKRAMGLVENLKGKGLRILIDDEEIDKISTVYLRRARGQYDPVQVKYMNGDLHTSKAIREQYEAEAATMRHIDEFSDFEGTPKPEEEEQAEVKKEEEEDEKMADEEEEENDHPEEVRSIKKGKEKAIESDVSQAVEESEMEWTKLDLYDRIELAVEAIREYRVSIINETAYENPDVDMEIAKDMVDVPGDQDAAMMYEAAMDVMEEGKGKKRKRHEEDQSHREEFWDAWMNPRKIIQPGKKHIIEKLVTGLSSSKWATIARKEIRQGLMASKHAPICTKEGRDQRGTRQLTPITISSQSSRRSTPALEELKKEKLPDWAKVMIDTIKVLQKKVARLEGEKLAAARVKERRGMGTEEPTRGGRKRPDSNRRKEAESINENRSEPKSTIGEVKGWAASGANLTPIGGKKFEPNTSAGVEEDWKKIGEDRRKKQLERIAERREKARKKEIIVEVRKGDSNQASSEQQPLKTAEEFIQKLGLDKEQVEKTMIISDEAGTPKPLRVVFKSEEAAEKALKEKKEDVELGKRLEIKRKEEDWAGIVVYGVDTQWEGKLEELKTHIEKENNITLMKNPHWMTKNDTRKTGKKDLVIHVATRKASEAIRGIKLADGYTYNTKDIKEHHTREYIARGAAKELQCTTCCKFGHWWAMCRARRARCGICGKEGHRTDQHKCDDETCISKGWCKNHRQFLKCANCKGLHGARSKWCRERENWFMMSIGMEPEKKENKGGESSAAKVVKKTENA